MNKLFFFNVAELTIQSFTHTDFISEFGEKTTTPEGVSNKFFFDESEHKIYCWNNGQKMPSFNGQIFAKEDAEKALFELALDHADHMILCGEFSEAQAQAKYFLEMARDEEWDAKTIEKLEALCC